MSYQPMYPNYGQQYMNAANQSQQRISDANQPYFQYNAQSQPTNSGILWVQGEAGAKSYLVAPNTTVLLMDSEAQQFYLKSTDNSGMPNLRTFEYAEKNQDRSEAESYDDKYVTKKEYRELEKKYSYILKKLDDFLSFDECISSDKKQSAKTNTTRNKGGNSDE